MRCAFPQRRLTKTPQLVYSTDMKILDRAVAEPKTNGVVRQSRLRLRIAALAALALLPTLFILLLITPLTLVAEPNKSPLQQNDLAVDMYVTTDSNGCETAPTQPEQSITVKKGSTLYYCLHLRNNTTSITFTDHLIADGSATNVRTTFAHAMPPGTEVKTWELQPPQTISEIAEVTGPETGIWVATDRDSGVQQQSSATVFVTVVNPVVVAALTVARGTTECGTASTIAVPSGSTNVSLCITLTNQGDVPLTSHQIVLTGNVNWTGTIARTIAPGGTLRITAANAAEFGLPSLTLPAVTSSNTSVQVTATSSESNGFTSASTATANVTVGSSSLTFTAVVRAEPITRLAECPRTAPTTLQVVRDTPVYYCMHLTNTGTVPLTLHHLVAITPTVNITFAYDLQPSSTLVLTNGTLAALGQPMVFGPITATTTLVSSFALTSTNSAGFRVALSQSLRVNVVEPTATPTETPSETPMVPTSTPTITPTPIPSNTPIPTMTPTMTPVPPTPTWTRSFVLSGLTTPTPAAQAAAEAPVPTVDFLGTAIARATLDTQATQNALAGLPPPVELAQPDSPLSPLEPPALPADLSQLTAIEIATLTAVALMGGEQFPAEGTPIPFPTPLPSATLPPTETPTVTPTQTQRPILYPTSLPPADLTTVFSQVFGSSAAATGFIFLLTGTLVFFGVAGGMLAYGFLRNSRRRYEVYEIEGDDIDGERTPQSGARNPTARGAGKEDWPSSLP